ncbi:MAG: FHA domain-containing protein, partial [Acidobacteria bacterium]|nr:FHA domain-containing protein [Acidobacteriota bacterium]
MGSPSFRIKTPQDPPRTVVLRTGTWVFGRSSSADVFVRDQSLSRLHARLRIDPSGEVSVEDMGSHNGTFLNGRRVEAVTPLTFGDELVLGESTIAYEQPAKARFEPSDEQPSATTDVKLYAMAPGGNPHRRSEMLELLYEVSREMLEDRTPEELSRFIVGRLLP